MAKIYRKFIKNKDGTKELLCQQSIDESVFLGDGRTLKEKLDNIKDNAEPNQNAFTTIKLDNNQTVLATVKEDTLNLVLDKNVNISVIGKELKIVKRAKLGKRLELDVDPVNGKNDNRENTPFKTIQGALDYVTTYYDYLEQGCKIIVSPGDYKEFLEIKNISNNLNCIIFESKNMKNIPDCGAFGNGNDYVRIQQIRMLNNMALIQLNGFLLDGFMPDEMIIGKSENGKDYVVLNDCVSNFNVIFYKCRFTEGLKTWFYYFGLRTFYSNVVIRDSYMGKFKSNSLGGYVSPIRVVDNSNVTLLRCKFATENQYDLVGEEGTIKARLCSRDNGVKTLVTSMSSSCFFNQGQ